MPKEARADTLEGYGQASAYIDALNEEASDSSDLLDLNAPIGTFIDSLRLSAQQLHALHNIPMTFFYLHAREGVLGQAYDLELVPQDRLNKDNYFTISKEGITHHKMKDSSFTSLKQWEREYTLFHKISRIRFFRQYRRWKVGAFPLLHSTAAFT